ncbi:hypothetical protein ACGFU4_35805 [Streptomyces sp. NPDC048511]|uniref:hypothetical protein n=1 Tax=Streptomyces sp. NPDC048511 TaxID=3365562 RepID=UPI00371B87BE
MIDNLGFHTDRDLHAELATLNRNITSLLGRVEIGNFYSWEDRYNTESDLANLQARAQRLADEIAEDDADTDRLLAAIRLVGDHDLGFIAYVVYGPKALPVSPLHEVRLIERDGGYTVPGSVRRRVPADQVAAVQRELLTGVVARNGHARIWGRTIRDYRTQVTAY